MNSNFELGAHAHKAEHRNKNSETSLAQMPINLS